MKKLAIMTIIMLSALVLAGCKFGSKDPAVTIPEDQPVQQVEELSIEVSNNTDIADELNVCYVFASVSDSDEWGEDHLGDVVIRSGDQHTITLEKGSYDIMIKDCNDFVLYTAWDVNRNTRIEIGGSGKIPLVVVNESDFEIAYMYISPNYVNDWGKDWLADKEMIKPQDGKRVFFVTPDTYDLKAVDLLDEVVATEEAVDVFEYIYWTISNK